MNSTTIGLISVACIFGGVLLGFWLQRLLPNHHLSEQSQEVIKLGAGMIATLTALVLGLLVSSAKSSFDAISDGIKQVGAKVILLDRVLAQYGPETKALRDQLRRRLAATVENLWPREHTGVPDLTSIERANGMELLQADLRSLVPKTDAQSQLLGQARQLAAGLSENRWLLIEQSQNPLPLALLAVLILWLTLLFSSFGLFAPRNATVVTVLFLCACSVSAAIFLVLEMNHPVTGLIKVSNAPFLKALEQMGR
jgi:hypothetical protein